jgi:hypothetical protein
MSGGFIYSFKERIIRLALLIYNVVHMSNHIGIAHGTRLAAFLLKDSQKAPPGRILFTTLHEVTTLDIMGSKA